ncbi:hypothetical protein EG68_01516 [Paragonimus skrjabini miyazakii]|uniref:Secreted protein n=1 Tax=Paragonimus skrjabini miyazakii TaxID=59628 RepID=A0A8S9Z371_9TREM|nr:hypothetical protein EG68_01516 [Paragonimus skrjabini miyazakii]
MRTLVLSLNLVAFLFGICYAQSNSAEELTNKIVQATKGVITKDVAKQMVEITNSTQYPESAKKALIDNIIKGANLTPVMQSALKRLLGGSGCRRSGSIILIFIMTMLHLLGI